MFKCCLVYRMFYMLHNFTDNTDKRNNEKVFLFFVGKHERASSFITRLLAFCIIIWKAFHRSPSWTFEQRNYTGKKFSKKKSLLCVFCFHCSNFSAFVFGHEKKRKHIKTMNFLKLFFSHRKLLEIKLWWHIERFAYFYCFFSLFFLLTPRAVVIVTLWLFHIQNRKYCVCPKSLSRNDFQLKKVWEKFGGKWKSLNDMMLETGHLNNINPDSLTPQLMHRLQFWIKF